MDPKNVKASWKGFFWFLFFLYVALLLYFTLLGDSMGRNITNILNWNWQAFVRYWRQSVNLIPFATIRLFMRAYRNGTLPFWPIVSNLLGNFMILMPVPFFLTGLFRRWKSGKKILVTLIGISLLIEVLQFVFLTGSCDVDDLLLNVAGGMTAYLIWNRLKKKGIIKK